MSYRIYVVDRVRATRDLLVGEIGSSARHDGRTEYSRKPFRRSIRLGIVIVFSFFPSFSFNTNRHLSFFFIVIIKHLLYTHLYLTTEIQKVT